MARVSLIGLNTQQRMKRFSTSTIRLQLMAFPIYMAFVASTHTLTQTLTGLPLS